MNNDENYAHLGFRILKEDRDLIERAANLNRSSISHYVLTKSLKAACDTIANGGDYTPNDMGNGKQ